MSVCVLVPNPAYRCRRLCQLLPHTSLYLGICPYHDICHPPWGRKQRLESHSARDPAAGLATEAPPALHRSGSTTPPTALPRCRFTPAGRKKFDAAEATLSHPEFWLFQNFVLIKPTFGFGSGSYDFGTSNFSKFSNPQESQNTAHMG